jgi:hypothetical protein
MRFCAMPKSLQSADRQFRGSTVYITAPHETITLGGDEHRIEITTTIDQHQPPRVRAQTN